MKYFLITVKYIIDRETETCKFENRKGRGKRPKPNDTDVKHLCLCYLPDRRKTETDLNHQINNHVSDDRKVSKSTVLRRANENGLFGRVVGKKLYTSIAKYFQETAIC